MNKKVKRKWRPDGEESPSTLDVDMPCPNCSHPTSRHFPRTPMTSFFGGSEGKGKPRWGCRHNRCWCGLNPEEIATRLRQGHQKYE